MKTSTPPIVLKKVYVHNLQGIDLTLNPGQLIVFTGVSGSGKSSLAFDTIFTEGQRRYLESLPPQARRQLPPMQKPDAAAITGISPTVAIEQKMGGRTPRSTVGTMTQIYDYLRVLYARIGIAHCPISQERLTPLSEDKIIHNILSSLPGKKILILAPFANGKKGEFKEELQDLVKKGFLRVRIDKTLYNLSEEIPALDKNLSHDIDVIVDRIQVSETEQKRILEAIELALEQGGGMMSVFDIETEQEQFFSRFAYSKKSDQYYPPLEPEDFSFNHPKGMCDACHGLGISLEFDLSKIIDETLSIKEDCCKLAGSYETVKWGNIYENLAKIYKFDISTPFGKLPKSAQDVFLYGTEKKWTRMRFVHPQTRKTWTDYVMWKGVLFEAKKRLNEAKSDLYKKKMFSLMHEAPCSDCKSSRLKPYPSATLVQDTPIHKVASLPIEDALVFFKNLSLSDYEKWIAKDLIREITVRLTFLNDVGLGYLTLDRSSPSLSGGETQRVRLASQIGSGLVGATYILDEPSIGLHQRDNKKLLSSLKSLRDKGNTVIVVEHDEETIVEADHIVDIGPGAGILGGQIVAEGSLSDITSHPKSLTGAYLSGKKAIRIPKKRRKPSDKLLSLKGASHNNLKKIDVEIPLGLFVAITGVSGSGKSSLIDDTLFPLLANHLNKADRIVGKYDKIEGLEHLDKVIGIDQSPIGRTPRSNPATYIKVFDDIRDLFAKIPESRAHGYKPGRFSFNVKEGSCPSCGGMGMIKIDMDFLSDEWITCHDCYGRRFDEKTLAITYREKNISDVLDMSIKEAHCFFENIPEIQRKLEFLISVGLDYVKLGQSSTTLSGGEAQRIKLAKELIRPPKEHTLYILDEPTTGLHFHDIHKLIEILQHLVDIGHSVIVIEHNLDLIKTVDWIIDIGPEGGAGGGQIIGKGAPEKIAKQSTPTGIHLAPVLAKTPYEKTTTALEKQPPIQSIIVQGVRQNNLKNLNVEIPLHQISVFTGPSGSGKTSLAFETIYAEGQRRYIDSLGGYAKQMIKQMPKAKVDDIQGLMAAIATEQKRHAGNPRSTVGTMSEIYDYLRIIFARLGTAYCPDTGEKIVAIDPTYVTDKILALPEKSKLQILSPIQVKRSDSIEALQERLSREGYLRVRLNGKYFEIDEKLPYNRKVKNTFDLVIDRLVVNSKNSKRLHDAIENAAKLSGGYVTIDGEGQDYTYNLAFAVESTGKSYPPITAQTFSFNTEEGMCLDCFGLGFRYGIDLSKDPTTLKKTPRRLFTSLLKDYDTIESEKLMLLFLDSVSIDPDLPISKLSAEQKTWLFEGSEDPIKTRLGYLTWRGVHYIFGCYAKHTTGEMRFLITQHLAKQTCSSCDGLRLNALARHVKLHGQSIGDATNMSIEDLHRFLKQVVSEHKGLTKSMLEVFEESINRLQFLSDVGLSYLSLSRSAPSLSGGETERLRLATQLGSQMTGSLYILDEPTIGLHPANNDLLNKALIQLKERGNTLIIVEHDPMTMRIADRIYDFGPASGDRGGEIMAVGTLEELKDNPNSLTGQYQSGKRVPYLRDKYRPVEETLSIKNANIHNLKGIDVEIPLRAMVCLTGVSGSGKSTLMHHILRPPLVKALAKKTRPKTLEYLGASITGFSTLTKVLSIDQSPIGQTIRSDVSTYVDLLTPLRSFFASLPEAKMRGLSPKNFSFNHRKGMCTKCFGLGHISIDLQFLPKVKTTCPACKGHKLNPLSLEVRYKEKHLGHVFSMSIEEATYYLPPIPKVEKILQTLISFGLGYLQIGRETASLSGGEASRLRLVKELIKPSRGHVLYLFDEPTIGLHDDDIDKLLPIFHQLVDHGHSVVFIEHNVTMMANSDWIIDLGPGAGDFGGQIVAEGTPEEICSNKNSSTGKYLKEHLAQQTSPQLRGEV